MDDRERFVLALINLPGVGRKSAWKVAREAKTTPSGGTCLYEETLRVLGSRAAFTHADADAAWDDAGRVLEEARKNGIACIASASPGFPAWLQNIPDPPLVLFVKGDSRCLNTPKAVAVVGTRKPTDYGNKVAHRFGMRVAEAGYVVVSGLALGCDSAGHRGCLDAGGKTVAVVAHGLGQRIYPKESRGLAEEILEKGGCWVSEYLPEARAQRSHFVERDRIQSGMSSGVIVVETDVDGGTMHTVRFAEQQGRPLACLAPPEAEFANTSLRGNAQLLQENRATRLRTAADLASFMQAVCRQASRWENGTAAANGHQCDTFMGIPADDGSPI